MDYNLESSERSGAGGVDNAAPDARPPSAGSLGALAVEGRGGVLGFDDAPNRQQLGEDTVFETGNKALNLLGSGLGFA